MIGDKVRGRSFEGQGVEVMIRCKILNEMANIGMPRSYAV